MEAHVEIDGTEIKKVASVGAGVIGYSYALKFAMAGLEVWAQNRTEQSSELARERVATSLASLVKNGVYTDAEAEQIFSRGRALRGQMGASRRHRGRCCT